MILDLKNLTLDNEETGLITIQVYFDDTSISIPLTHFEAGQLAQILKTLADDKTNKNRYRQK